MAFAFLTPFFFLRGGMNISLAAVFANLAVLAAFLAAKMVPKLGLVYPLARRHARPNATFTTLLMSTGLTFGTISALYGLTAHIIDRTQFSLADYGGRAVGDRAYRDRPALVLTSRTGRARPSSPAARAVGDPDRRVTVSLIHRVAALYRPV